MSETLNNNEVEQSGGGEKNEWEKMAENAPAFNPEGVEDDDEDILMEPDVAEHMFKNFFENPPEEPELSEEEQEEERRRWEEEETLERRRKNGYEIWYKEKTEEHIEKGDFEYKFLARDSIDPAALHELERVAESNPDMEKALDVLKNRVAYSGKEEGEFYDIYRDRDTGEILMGEAAKEGRMREVTRWMTEGDENSRGDAEMYREQLANIPPTLVNYLDQTIDMVDELSNAVGLNGPDDYEPVLYRGRVRQNIADTFYTGETTFIRSDGKRDDSPRSYSEGGYGLAAGLEDFPPDNWSDKDYSTSEIEVDNFWMWESRDNKYDSAIGMEMKGRIEGDEVCKSRMLMREIDLYDMPIKETKEYKENAAKLDPKLLEWIGKTQERAISTAPDTWEPYALTLALNQKIMEGAFNDKSLVEDFGDPAKSPFRIVDAPKETFEELVFGSKEEKPKSEKGKVKFTVKKKKIA